MFSISEFARVNRVILIWVLLAGLLYLLKDLFPLIFLTFVMCFITHGVTSKLYRFTKRRRKYLVVLLYVFFLLCLTCFSYYGLPKIYEDAKPFTTRLNSGIVLIHEWVDEMTAGHPELASLAQTVKENVTFDVVAAKAWSQTRSVLEQAWRYITLFLFSILFSFLIMLDLPNLIVKFRLLRYSRVGAIYEETASSVFRFSQVVGENFRAQIFISLINTCLTVMGLSVIGTGSVALLAFVVFMCGLIPVLGVIVSSVPVFMVALGQGGWHMALWASGLIVFIHLIEAYVLNPRVISAFLHLNPVLTLMILYVSYSIMGLWGMLLGVPITVYFYRQVIVPNAKNGRVPRRGGEGPPGPSGTVSPPAGPPETDGGDGRAAR
jgi:predicted PurR-regulated permease PerM